MKIAGINFDYDAEDQRYIVANDDGEPDVSEEGFMLMCDIWHHAMHMFKEFDVSVPVRTALRSFGTACCFLCAIGCGAFLGVVKSQGVRTYARALFTVLQNDGYRTDAVVVSLPSSNHYEIFQDELRSWKSLMTTVVLP